MWGPPGSFSPDCLESLTLETYASRGSLSSSMVLCRPDMELCHLALPGGCGYVPPMTPACSCSVVGEGFPPPPEKDLESPSSKCLEALVPSLD